MISRAKNLQSGQVGLVILLITAVILTVAVSLSQRTIQQQDSAITQDESTRVFNAAESGIESALFDITKSEQSGTQLGIGNNFALDNSDVTYSISQSNQFEMFVTKGDTVEIPLSGSSGTTSISWWDRSGIDCASDNPSAIVVSVLNISTAKQYAYDPCADVRNTNFEEVTAGVGDYKYSVTVNLDAQDRLIRIKPLFSNTKFLISGSTITLAQYDVSSTALNTQEDIARTIELKRSLPGSYSFMDYTLVSGSTLTK